MDFVVSYPRRNRGGGAEGGGGRLGVLDHFGLKSWFGFRCLFRCLGVLLRSFGTPLRWKTQKIFPLFKKFMWTSIVYPEWLSFRRGPLYLGNYIVMHFSLTCFWTGGCMVTPFTPMQFLWALSCLWWSLCCCIWCKIRVWILNVVCQVI